jgi:hypothetical protein
LVLPIMSPSWPSPGSKHPKNNWGHNVSSFLIVYNVSIKFPYCLQSCSFKKKYQRWVLNKCFCIYHNIFAIIIIHINNLLFLKENIIIKRKKHFPY